MDAVLLEGEARDIEAGFEVLVFLLEDGEALRSEAVGDEVHVPA